MKKLNKRVGKIGHERTAQIIRQMDRQQGALLLLLLPEEDSAGVMRHLTTDEAGSYMFEIARIDASKKGDIKDAYKVFKQFSKDKIVTGGLDKGYHMVAEALGHLKASELMEELTSPLQAEPFSFIQKQDDDVLCRILDGEMSQTIAVVLAHFPAERAAVMCERFGALGDDISKRIMNMRTPSPDVMREIERVMERRISEPVRKIGGPGFFKPRTSRTEENGQLSEEEINALLEMAAEGDREIELQSQREADAEVQAQSHLDDIVVAMSELVREERDDRAVEHDDGYGSGGLTDEDLRILLATADDPDILLQKTKTIFLPPDHPDVVREDNAAQESFQQHIEHKENL